MELSRKALAIAPSATLAIDSKAKQLKAAGEHVIGFAAGEPDFDTPAYICEAAKAAMDRGETRYTPVAGTLSLRKAVCAKLKKENGLDYTPAQIVVSNGAKHSLFNTFQAILNPGDEVIIPAPFWVSYPELVQMADGVPVIVDTREEDGFRLRLEELEAAITPRTKALVFCNPCNPTGMMYTHADLEAIAALAVKHGFFLVSDEIYEKLCYAQEQPVSIATISPEAKALTILINGASKAYAMTGWRIGYAACEEQIAKVMTNLQSQATSSPNSIAQAAVEAALTHGNGEVAAMVQEFKARRDVVCAGINAIPGMSCRVPDGAFYILINIKDLLGKSYQGVALHSAMDFAQALLDAQKVALVPGEAFRAEGYVRVSYATSMENIQEGVRRMAAFVGELK